MSKKTIRIFAFENKEKKKKAPYYLHNIRFLRKNTYSKVPFESISNGAQYVSDPAKIVFTSKFSYILFFATLLIKLKLGQQIANHVDQSL
jgi:hypothetical protein